MFIKNSVSIMHIRINDAAGMILLSRSAPVDR
jgi:hypothetical protein